MPPPFGWRKRLVFGVVLALGTALLVELASALAYAIASGERFSYAAVQEQMLRIKNTPIRTSLKRAARSAEGLGVVHPYVGFVNPPDPGDVGTELGFVRAHREWHRRAPDKLVLGIFGGSVAAAFCHEGVPVLARELTSDPRYAGREVEVVCTAMGGFKQPQQLMALNYLLTLGLEFDLIVEIDGFNEVALHASENAHKGVHPVYPRTWFLQTAELPDAGTRRLIGEISFYEARRKKWAKAFATTLLEYSVTADFVWWAIDRRYAARIAEANEILREYAPPEDRSNYQMTGPPASYASEDELYTELAEIWKRSSLQMARLCAANDIECFFFLQPNQYLAGSKPMGAAEREIAINPDHAYRGGALKGYPHLIRLGAELRAEGVRFGDLTRVFASVREPLYTDDCCHFNARGNEILAAAVAREILAPQP